MQVHAISVEKLFGRFDHTIELKREERITILHGPNGYGKTAVLRLVNALANGEYSTLRQTPFHTLRITYEDGYWVEVERSEEPDASNEPAIRLKCSFGGNDWDVMAGELPEDQLDPTGVLPLLLEHLVESWNDLSWPALWKRLQQHSRLNIHFIFLAAWFSTSPVHLVGIQRLLVPHQTEKKKAARVPRSLGAALLAAGEPETRSFRTAVEVYSNEFRDRLQTVQTEYAHKSQQLERSFAKRLIVAGAEVAHGGEELQAEIIALEKRRVELMELGLLPNDDEEGQEQPSTESQDDSTRRVLWLYTRDNRDKLSVFDDLAARVGLLTELINRHFAFKRLCVDSKQGFWFANQEDGSELSPGHLSSGEQHQLIMLYELLFRMKEDSLVLIDEPELSLHVSWQVEFLRDMQRIIEIAKIDVLVATHSPQIIHDRWDLTVELEAPEAPEAAAQAG